MTDESDWPWVVHLSRRTYDEAVADVRLIQPLTKDLSHRVGSSGGRSPVTTSPQTAEQQHDFFKRSMRPD